MGLFFKIIPYSLKFKFDARTSRGSLSEHKTWFIRVWDDQQPEISGIGECAPFEGLSVDDTPDFEDKLRISLLNIEGSKFPTSLKEIEEYIMAISDDLPAVKFGLETALRDLFYGGKRKVFDSPFYNQQETIKINGLVWIGSKEEMLKRLQTKLKEGFDCIKIKIGSLPLADELDLIKCVRLLKSSDDLSLRLDANGAYQTPEVDNVLSLLAKHDIHSIEQPIKADQIEAMAKISQHSPIPIALDEELFGVVGLEAKRKLLETIKPQFIVLKPTLLGGFAETAEWIPLAEQLEIGWWITSALESNIGLNAICQFTSQYKTSLPQGLGTGGLYLNNILSPLTINSGSIYWDKQSQWDLGPLNKLV